MRPSFRPRSTAGLAATLVGSVKTELSDRPNFELVALLPWLNILVSRTLICVICLLMGRVKTRPIPGSTSGILNTLLFLPSGAMYPVESFPPWLQMLARVGPFTCSVHARRSSLPKGSSLDVIVGDAVLLSYFSTFRFPGVLLQFPRRL